jgi:solute:Na+ symporter, SSS family
LTGWAVGLASGTAIAFSDGVKPVHTLTIGDGHYAIYTGLLALALNLVVATIVQLVLPKDRAAPAPVRA